MSLYIPKMSDTPAITIPGLASSINALADSRIVEYGSNENGEYWRWENGLQMCMFTQDTIELTEPIPPGKTLSLTFTYPASFFKLPALAVAGRLYRPEWFTVDSTVTPYSRYTAFANVIVHNVTETNNGTHLRFVSILAIGRWK